MLQSWGVLTVILVVSAMVGALVLARQRKPPAQAANDKNSQPAVTAQQAVPDQIVIADGLHQPIVTLRASNAFADFERATPFELGGGAISHLSALAQAAPSLLVATSANSKQLMEVVVNGNLVRAADGNGLRAIAMGPNGIHEHARLFEVKPLENMINAAAVWQIASVIVAQKHLADISKKLDEIKVGVQDLACFLEDQRRSRIQATYDYLNQIYVAIKGGELSPAVRSQLEARELDLAEILTHLSQEYRHIAGRKVEHREALGTGKLEADIGKKLDRLNQLGHDIEFCIQTRIAAWHVLALFPGEAQLKLARRANIEASVAEVSTLAPPMAALLQDEIAALDSMWNRSATLTERRTGLLRRVNSTQQALVIAGQSARSGIMNSGDLLLTDDTPTRMWLEFEHGAVTSARIEAR